MINSIPTTTNTFSEQAPKKPPLLTVLMYRLLLLGVGGGLAGFLGIVLATLYPNPHAHTPLLVQVLDLVKTGNAIAPSAAPEAIASSNSSEAATIASANINQGNTSATPQLDVAAKAQLQTQLAQLQAQMKELSDRAATIENQLGTANPNRPLEARLQAISTQLAATPNLNQSQSNQLATASAPSEQTEAFKLTLPSDLLFQQNYTMLNSEAGTILDTVINDLRSYKGATIRIAVHTNNASQPEDNRELSFRRAHTVQQYLSAMLGDKYRWVVIGYGNTRPLVANDSEINQQRNRRLEISIDSRED